MATYDHDNLKSKARIGISKQSKAKHSKAAMKLSGSCGPLLHTERLPGADCFCAITVLQMKEQRRARNSAW